MTAADEQLPLSAKIGLSAMGIAGNIATFLIPLIIGGLVDDYGYTINRASFVAFGDMFGLGVGTLLWSAIMHHANWRRSAIMAMLLVVTANAASALFTQYSILFAIRILAGTGAGTLLALTNSGLSHSRDPDRTVGLYMFVVLLFASVAYFVFPRVIESSGMVWFFLSLAAVAGMLGLGSFWVPAVIASVQVQRDGGGLPLDRTVPTWIKASAALGVFFWFFSASLTLAYIERIARIARLSTEQIALSLGLSQLFGAAGGLSAALLSTRLGNRSVPVLVSTMLAISCCGILLTDFSPFAFTYAVCALIFGWDAIYPYVIGQLKALDHSARLVSISITMMAAGKAFSVLYGGLVLNGTNYEVISWSGIGAFLLALLCFTPSLLISDRQLRAGSNSR